MAAAFQAVGSAVGTVTTSLALVAPALLGGDVMFAAIHSNNNTAPTIAAGGWETIVSANNTTAQNVYLAWRRCSDADTGATFTWTVAGTTVSFGALVTYRNATRGGDTGLPHFASSTSANASADNITYATLSPKNPAALIVAFGYYGLAATTAGAFSGTFPTMTNRLDAETASGIGASLFIHDGPSLNGAATGARTCASASTIDAINYGILIDVLPLELPGSSTGHSPKYPAITRGRW